MPQPEFEIVGEGLIRFFIRVKPPVNRDFTDAHLPEPLEGGYIPQGPRPIAISVRIVAPFNPIKRKRGYKPSDVGRWGSLSKSTPPYGKLLV